MQGQNIRIRLKAYDHRLLDTSTTEIVNPNGGAIALGHPVGATGAIILTKLIYELIRINGRFGLATMCIGGGQGIAVIVDTKV